MNTLIFCATRGEACALRDVFAAHVVSDTPSLIEAKNILRDNPDAVIVLIGKGAIHGWRTPRKAQVLFSARFDPDEAVRAQALGRAYGSQVE